MSYSSKNNGVFYFSTSNFNLISTGEIYLKDVFTLQKPDISWKLKFD